MTDSKSKSEPTAERPASSYSLSSDAPVLEPLLTTDSTSEPDTATPFQNLAKAQIEGAIESIGDGNMAWLNSKKVAGLWCINQNKNSWARISGIGFKKLSNKSSSGNVALTILMAHARITNSSINYRDESDAEIHEVYAW